MNNPSFYKKLEEAVLQTPIGNAHIFGDDTGVCKISITDKDLSVTKRIISEPVRICFQELGAYFRGELHKFTFPLRFEGTDFQKRVWRALLEIPYGKTLSYLELARQLGDEKAVRAVAAANGKNPLWIVVPCHRVIGSDGSLTGYAGGLWRKKWLLEHEGAIKQMSLF